MRNRSKHWSETEFACFVCDFWWLLLLIILLVIVTVFTSSIWLPLLGFPANNGDDPQVLATPTSLVEEPLSTEVAWKTFNDPELGYSIQYPSNWLINEPDTKQQVGYIESVILAEHQGITSQTRDFNENARVLIMSYPKVDVELQIWVITHWNWLDGQLEENQINGFRTITASVIPAESTLLNSILWVERENDILCFWAQTETDAPQNETIVHTMLDRITFLR